MDNLPTIAFFVLFILFGIYFAYMFFTKKGQLQSVKMIVGSDLVVDLGELGHTQFKTKIGYNVDQTIKMYKCFDSTDSFYVLETTQRNIGAITRFYTKLTMDSVEKIKSLSQT